MKAAELWRVKHLSFWFLPLYTNSFSSTLPLKSLLENWPWKDYCSHHCPLRVILVGSLVFCFCFFACVASFDFENCPALHPQPGKAALLRRPLCPMG